MRGLMAVLLALPALAGCFGDDGASTSDATDAVEKSQREAERRYEYVLFLGVTGTEGDMDWDLYEEALASSSSPGPAIAESFDQDRDFGAFGDGRLGSWLTTHFAYDEDRRLIGGLYTQILADGSRDAVFASFKGPYSGTTALPALQHAQMAQAAMLEPGLLEGTVPVGGSEEGAAPVLCTLVTDTGSWRISSREAAEIAQQVPEVQAHMQSLPEGEFTYHYFPSLGVEEGCPAALDASGNKWTIYHTDLDSYLTDSGPAPTAARVEIDAATGEVTDVEVGPLYIRPPDLVEGLITATDPTIPENGPVRHNITFPVDGDAQRLQLTAYRTQWPEPIFDDESVLRMPDGRILERQTFDNAIHRYAVHDPAAGDWQFEYRYRSMATGGEHAVELHGLVEYQ